MKTKMLAIVASAFVASVAFGYPTLNIADVQDVSPTVPQAHNLRLFTNDNLGFTHTLKNPAPKGKVTPTTTIFGYPWQMTTYCFLQLTALSLCFSCAASLESDYKKRSRVYG